MPEKFNELLLKQDIIELYNAGISPDYGYLMNGRFEKDMIKTLYPLKTLSGNPITWKASDTEYLFPIVSLEPKQAGSGDPSPENVRPISGYDSVKVNVRGKNLFNISKIENNHEITNNDDGSLTITPGIGTTAAKTGKTLRELCDGITPGTYTINAETTGSNKIVYTQVIGTWAFGKSKTLTDEMLDSMLYLYASEEGSTATISDIQLEVGSTPTPYEPFQPGTTATLTLPGTIYGGTVDAVSGVGEKTWEFVEFDGTEKWYLYPNPNDAVKTFFAYVGIESYTNYINVLCDRASFLISTWSKNGPWTISSSAASNAFYISVPNDVASTVEQWKSYLAAQASAGTPVQVAYKLATPEPFQATGNQALTIQPGNHTIYTNGDTISLTRKARRLEV